MPAIADQVTSLENDHAAALAKIDALTAANGQLTDSLNSLTTDHAAALVKVADLTTHNANILAMVESVAASALAMMKAAAPIALAEKVVADVTAKIESAVSDVIPFAKTGAPPVLPADVPTAALAQKAAGLINDAMADIATAAVLPPVSPVAPVVIVPKPTLLEGLETKIAEIPAAVERMLHHSSGSPATIRRPVDMTMHVEHDDGGLPIFLRRGTVFQRGDAATL